MGYNKDLNITPIPLLLYSNNYTTSHSRAHCDINESGHDVQIITGQPRWNPTPEQMMVLQEVYNSGMRTPTTQQIQEIAFKLQKYGRIEGKNVFYWFQNHKSRERLKRRRHHNQQERFGFNNVHEEPLSNKDNVLAWGNNNSSVSRRRGDHRVIHTMTCLSSLSTHPQNNNIDHGKMEEYDHRGMEDEKEATCQNQIHRINTFYNLNITSKGTQETEREVNVNEHRFNLNEEEEEETRRSRTLDLFPVKENQEKTGFAEKNTKPNHSCCNYYYYYEFMPLMN